MSRAFDLVMERDAVASCSVEPEHARIRLLAAPGLGDALAGRIYLDGGLIWSSRHPIREPPRTD